MGLSFMFVDDSIASVQVAGTFSNAILFNHSLPVIFGKYAFNLHGKIKKEVCSKLPKEKTSCEHLRIHQISGVFNPPPLP